MAERQWSAESVNSLTEGRVRRPFYESVPQDWEHPLQRFFIRGRWTFWRRKIKEAHPPMPMAFTVVPETWVSRSSESPARLPPLTATCCAWLRLQVAVPVGTSVLPPVVWLIPILHPFSNALLWRVTWAIRAWRDNTSRVLQVSTFSRPVSHRVF